MASRPVGFIVIAEPHGRVADGVRTLVVAELITGFALLALLAAGGRWLIGRGLAPLDQMATTAQRITTQGDLTARMPDPGDHAEVGGLADAINTMLDRIQQAFTARWRSEQKVRQFAADASHELRTPLTTIRGYAELYGQGALDPDQLTTAMRRIDEESQRMSQAGGGAAGAGPAGPQLLAQPDPDRPGPARPGRRGRRRRGGAGPPDLGAGTGRSWPWWRTNRGSARCWPTCWPTCASTPRPARRSRSG